MMHMLIFKSRLLSCSKQENYFIRYAMHALEPYIYAIPYAPFLHYLSPTAYIQRRKKMRKNCILLFRFIASSAMVEAQTCRPSGGVRGKKPPKNVCNHENDSDCCKERKLYSTYKCSPPVSSSTEAILTVNSFRKDGDGGGPSACDGKYHSDSKPVVALSTGWFNKKKTCKKQIAIHANGRTVKATVVDECDSTKGCSAEHAYQPPCHNNIVDASKAVWEGLGIREGQDEWGWMEIHWTDA